MNKLSLLSPSTIKTTTTTTTTPFTIYINNLDEKTKQYISKISNQLYCSSIKLVAYCYLFDGIIFKDIILDHIITYISVVVMPWNNIYNRPYIVLPSDGWYKHPRVRVTKLDCMYERHLDYIFIDKRGEKVKLNNIRKSHIYKTGIFATKRIVLDPPNRHHYSINNRGAKTFMHSVQRDGDIVCDIYVIVHYIVKDKNNYYNEILDQFNHCYVSIGNQRHECDIFNNENNCIMIYERPGFNNQYLVGTTNTCSPIPICQLAFHDVKLKCHMTAHSSIRIITITYTDIMLEHKNKIGISMSLSYFGSQKTHNVWLTRGGMACGIPYPMRNGLHYLSFYNNCNKEKLLVNYKHELFKEIKDYEYSFIYN